MLLNIACALGGAVAGGAVMTLYGVTIRADIAKLAAALEALKAKV